MRKNRRQTTDGGFDQNIIRLTPWQHKPAASINLYEPLVKWCHSGISRASRGRAPHAPPAGGPHVLPAHCTCIDLWPWESAQKSALSWPPYLGALYYSQSKCSINIQRIVVYPKNRDNWYTCVSLVNLFHIMWLKYTKNKGSEIQCCVVYLHILHYTCQTRFPEYYVFTVFGFGSLLLIKSFRIRITMLSCFWLHPWTANIILSNNSEPHTSVNL